MYSLSAVHIYDLHDIHSIIISLTVIKRHKCSVVCIDVFIIKLTVWDIWFLQCQTQDKKNIGTVVLVLVGVLYLVIHSIVLLNLVASTFQLNHNL